VGKTLVGRGGLLSRSCYPGQGKRKLSDCNCARGGKEGAGKDSPSQKGEREKGALNKSCATVRIGLLGREKSNIKIQCLTLGEGGEKEERRTTFSGQKGGQGLLPPERQKNLKRRYPGGKKRGSCGTSPGKPRREEEKKEGTRGRKSAEEGKSQAECSSESQDKGKKATTERDNQWDSKLERSRRRNEKEIREKGFTSILVGERSSLGESADDNPVLGRGTLSLATKREEEEGGMFKIIHESKTGEA